MTGIIDYGMGNLLSVMNALEFLGAEPQLCRHPRDLEDADRLVLPGVGAFGDCMRSLQESGFDDALNHHVMAAHKPILGICLGMQVMARRGTERGDHEGLGWFDAEVIPIRPDDPGLAIPHVGWNNVVSRSGCPLFDGLPAEPDLYFVHSFFMDCRDSADVVASCDYGGAVTAAVMKRNVFATQFHPEKSQDHGLRILQNFIEWNPMPC